MRGRVCRRGRSLLFKYRDILVYFHFYVKIVKESHEGATTVRVTKGGWMDGIVTLVNRREPRGEKRNRVAPFYCYVLIIIILIIVIGSGEDDEGGGGEE